MFNKGSLFKTLVIILLELFLLVILCVIVRIYKSLIYFSFSYDSGKTKRHMAKMNLNTGYLALILYIITAAGCNTAQSDPLFSSVSPKSTNSVTKLDKKIADTASYKKRMIKMANGDSSGKWVFKNEFPNEGAILPYKRIIAYYGNLYSTRMGILGELPKKEMFSRLKKELDVWQKADPETPTVPALHYIVTTAQDSPGSAGLYRLRMPSSEIDKVMAMAEEINAIVFLDVQVGLSTLRDEIPVLEKYLKNPRVHLGIDPEFSMKGGQKPGSVIGSFDAEDVNYASSYLASLVNKYNLPPKVLILHRFTKGMLKGTKEISASPAVQIVVDMDGWGAPERKINTYKQFVHAEPVQFTGFKLFYKNDLKEPPHRMLTPEQLLSLKPIPMYIQYQ